VVHVWTELGITLAFVWTALKANTVKWIRMNVKTVLVSMDSVTTMSTHILAPVTLDFPEQIVKSMISIARSRAA